MSKTLNLFLKSLVYWCRTISIVVICLFLSNNLSFAAHPLTTDDTGTQGKGKFQIEAQSEFIFDKKTEVDVEVKTRAGQYQGVLTYGLLDNLDIVFGIPYIWGKVKEDGVTVYDEKGISDLSVEAKWRFLELDDGFSFALKPTVTLPTGDNKKGLGAGKTTYGITFITTKEMKPFAVHLNLGYTYNDNKLDERKDIWRASIASEVEIIKALRLVIEAGLQKNPNKLSETNPVFATGGVIYSLAENLDMDFGVRAGLNRAEADVTVLGGLTFRF